MAANFSYDDSSGKKAYIERLIAAGESETVEFKLAACVDICEIKVQPFHDLVFVDDMLYVKQGNRTVQLKGQDIIEYHKTRRMSVKISE